MKRKKVAIFSDVNPTKSYSCLQHLAESLSDRGIDVTLYAKIPISDLKHTKAWRCHVISIYSFIYGKIPFFRRYIAQLHLFFLSVFYYENIIIHELVFFRLAWLAKKLNRNLNIIHYATELYDENDEPSHKKLLDFYRNNSNLPDLVIECNEQRSKLRRVLFGICSPIVVIENSLPSESIIVHKNFIEDVGYKKNQCTLVYTGAAYLHRELDRLIDAFYMSGLGEDLKLKLVCYGPVKDVDVLRAYCDKMIPGKYELYSNVSRDEAMEYVSQSDIGVVYYRPSLSMGNRFAAPTKFYEYLSLGLPIVCSNNDSLIPIIDKYNIGQYVNDESTESLSYAIVSVYKDYILGHVNKAEVKNIFNTNLAYNITAGPSIKILVEKLV
ncbi:glycosyltransferase [Shewanella baltica]|uniref:glycosyltransferase n=1 Tax=Shewanella baltica TaxID=62322 RepID=UPI00217F18F6|nr:glycosyltransferase [Shewanella baltica]MCS6175148.1 glycosyltransferase family 4 protein [Shewanella baltica]